MGVSSLSAFLLSDEKVDELEISFITLRCAKFLAVIADIKILKEQFRFMSTLDIDRWRMSTADKSLLSLHYTSWSRIHSFILLLSFVRGPQNSTQLSTIYKLAVTRNKHTTSPFYHLLPNHTILKHIPRCQ